MGIQMEFHRELAEQMDVHLDAVSRQIIAGLAARKSFSAGSAAF